MHLLKLESEASRTTSSLIPSSTDMVVYAMQTTLTTNLRKRSRSSASLLATQRQKQRHLPIWQQAVVTAQVAVQAAVLVAVLEVV
jgi:hypothetical protein